jgi:hypothetical protein
MPGTFPNELEPITVPPNDMLDGPEEEGEEYVDYNEAGMAIPASDCDGDLEDVP